MSLRWLRLALGVLALLVVAELVYSYVRTPVENSGDRAKNVFDLPQFRHTIIVESPVGRLLCVIVAVVILYFTESEKPSVCPVGKNKWATLADMRDAGLVPDQQSGTQVIVGRFKGKLLSYSGPEHQLVTGATRSGKGVGHVVPTLLGGWMGSVLVLDIKSELWETTAGFRSQFSNTFFFNPTRLDSVRYNPLLEVRRDENQIRDVQNIVNLLVNPDGSKQVFDIWDEHAMLLLSCTILHVLHGEEEKSLGRVRDLLLDFDRSLPAMMDTELLIDPDTGERRSHPEVSRIATDMSTQPPKFMAGVKATALSYLQVYADELVRRNTATSDFRLSDLMCAEHPVSLYLQPPASDGPRLRPLMRMMLNQACRVLMADLDTDGQGRAKNHKLLLELDEFPTLGKLDFLQDALRKLTGYGVKAHIIAQSISDITEAYGQHTSFLDNIHVQVAFGSSDTSTQQRISQMTGTVTEYRKGYSKPRGVLSYFMRSGRSGSVSESEQVRPLLQPGEVRELPDDEQLVFITGKPPIRCNKIRYYEDRVFKDRQLPPPDQSNLLDVPACDTELLHPWTDTCPIPVAEEDSQIEVPDSVVVEDEPAQSDVEDLEPLSSTKLGHTPTLFDDDPFGL